jgi:Zn-dependent alcohol dehydrogenase
VNLLTAKAMGAAEVVVTDINEGRLEVAKTLGADHVYKVCTFKNLVVCLNKLELWPCAKVDLSRFRCIHNGGKRCPDGIDKLVTGSL